MVNRLLEKGFFHRVMRYEKGNSRRRRLKDEKVLSFLSEKKGTKEETGVTDFICVKNFMLQGK